MKKIRVTDGKSYFSLTQEWTSRFSCGGCAAKGDNSLCDYLKSTLLSDITCGGTGNVYIWKQDSVKHVISTVVTVKCPKCNGTGATECHMQDYPCHMCEPNGTVNYTLFQRKKRK